MKTTRLLAAAVSLLALGWMEARAECRTAPEASSYLTLASETAAGDAQTGRSGRMVAPVMVDGQGPFRFIVDTGANRSVLSTALAARLGLPVTGQGQVNSVFDVADAPLVHVNSIQYGGLTLSSRPLPILEGPALAGEHGLLGVDGMAGRRLLLDFEHRCIEITASRHGRAMRGWSTIPGVLRFGNLVVVRGEIDGHNVNVLVDTGSDTTLANNALRNELQASLRSANTPYQFMYSINAPSVLRGAVFVPKLMIGDMEARNVLAYVGDFHIFELWGLHDEPTLLLGMDVLSHSRAIAIDYGSATVHMRLDRLSGIRIDEPAGRY